MTTETPHARVTRIEAEAVGRDLSSWEKHQFLPSIKQRVILSERQEKCLLQIERRIFDGESG
jgi:hypothetical protein